MFIISGFLDKQFRERHAVQNEEFTVAYQGLSFLLATFTNESELRSEGVDLLIDKISLEKDSLWLQTSSYPPISPETSMPSLAYTNCVSSPNARAYHAL